MATASQEKNWKENLADLKYKMALAHDAVQIDKDMRRQAVVERLIKKTQDGTLMQQTDEPMDKQIEEEMAVRIGDESHIHYHNEQKEPQQVPQASSGLGKALATAGLAAIGVGGAASLPILAWNLSRQDQQAVVDTDTDTQYGLRIYRDELDSE